MLNEKRNRIEFQAIRWRNNDKIYISKSETDAILPGRCGINGILFFFLESTFGDSEEINRLRSFIPNIIQITIIIFTAIIILTSSVSFIFRNN